VEYPRADLQRHMDSCRQAKAWAGWWVRVHVHCMRAPARVRATACECGGRVGGGVCVLCVRARVRKPICGTCTMLTPVSHQLGFSQSGVIHFPFHTHVF
jgi:hypothetical protein